VVFSFSTAALLDSLLDGVVIGGILAIILVALRGPLTLPSREGDKPAGRKRKSRKVEQVSAPSAARKAGLGDYLTAWAMLAVVAASASYAVATGHGAYGLITSAVKGFRAVSDPARLLLTAILDVAFFAAMGAALWTGIWWITRSLLRLIRRSWAERTKLIHGTIFGLVVGGLLGFSVCFTEAIAGRIVGPLELLRSARNPPAYQVGHQVQEGRDAGHLC
jgi:hypothetical protein